MISCYINKLNSPAGGTQLNSKLCLEPCVCVHIRLCFWQWRCETMQNNFIWLKQCVLVCVSVFVFLSCQLYLLFIPLWTQLICYSQQCAAPRCGDMSDINKTDILYNSALLNQFTTDEFKLTRVSQPFQFLSTSCSAETMVPPLKSPRKLLRRMGLNGVIDIYC